jgi:hypothetical protein
MHIHDGGATLGEPQQRTRELPIIGRGGNDGVQRQLDQTDPDPQDVIRLAVS